MTSHKSSQSCHNLHLYKKFGMQSFKVVSIHLCVDVVVSCFGCNNIGLYDVLFSNLKTVVTRWRTKQKSHTRESKFQVNVSNNNQAY